MKTLLIVLAVLLLGGGLIMLFLRALVALAVVLLIVGVALVLYLVFKGGRAVESFSRNDQTPTRKP